MAFGKIGDFAGCYLVPVIMNIHSSELFMMKSKPGAEYTIFQYSACVAYVWHISSSCGFSLT